MKNWVATTILFAILAIMVITMSGWGEAPINVAGREMVIDKEEPAAVDRAMVLEKSKEKEPQAADRAMVLAKTGVVKEQVTYFDVPINEELQNHIFKLGKVYDINPAIITSIIEKESSYISSKVGDGGDSFGLMQIQPKWHRERMERLGCYNLLDPFENITVGVDYLAELIDRKRGMAWALMAYNGGPSYANSKKEVRVISEYARDVLERAKEIAGVEVWGEY